MEPRLEWVLALNCIRDYKTVVGYEGRIRPIDVKVYASVALKYYWCVAEQHCGLRIMTGDECDQIVLECALDPILSTSSLIRLEASNV